MTNIPFYKLKAVLRGAWTLEDAAYLLCGYNPATSNFEITLEAPNKVSQFYYWLKAHNGRLKNLNTITQTLQEKLPARYSIDQILGLMEHTSRQYDGDLSSLRQQILGQKTIAAATTRAFYRGVGEIIWGSYNGLFKEQVSEILTALPEKLEEKYQFKLEQKTAIQISELLKGLSPHEKGAPPKHVKVKTEIDWPQIIEKI